MLRQNKKAFLAVDLGADAVRILDVRTRKEGPEIVKAVTGAVLPGATDTLADRQLATLETLLTGNNIRTKTCVVAVPTALVVSRIVSIDANKQQTPDEQVRWTLQNCIPFDIKDLTFDYWPVQELDPKARTRDVLVVATQSSIVQRYLAGFEHLRLTCEHMDVAPCAIASLIPHISKASEAMVGTVSIGSNNGYFAIVEKQRVLFLRPFEITTAGAQSISAAKTSLDRVGDEISKCVSHMVGSMHLDNMAELAVFGNGADDELFREYLHGRFHIPITSPSVLDAFAPNATAEDLRGSPEASSIPHFAAAAGLAIQANGGAAWRN